MPLIIVVLLLLVLLGGVSPFWGYSHDWGYGPFGGTFGLIVIVVVVVLVLRGRRR